MPVTDILDAIDRWVDGKRDTPTGRTPTRKEIAALGTANLAGRVRHALERRVGRDGRLLPGALDEARRDKLRRFREARFLSGMPAGPECAWLSVGPRNVNGRIKSLAVHPTNGQVLYAGAANGGVWKSIDGGESWRPTMHAEASLAIGAVAVDPASPDTVYAGTGEPLVYFSTSGGLLPPGSETLAWWYEGTGVLKSTDGAATWAPTGPIANTFVYRVAVDPFDSQHVLCAGYSSTGGGGLCRSTDGGTTWTTVVPGIVTDVVFDPVNQGRVYAGQQGAGVLKSIDGGQTWAARNGAGAAALPAVDIGRVSLTLACAAPDVLYAQIEDDGSGGLLGVYRTTSAADPPAGWTPVTSPPITGLFWWNSFIAADPTDATGQIVFAGARDVARSSDGGVTWELLTDSVPGDDPSPPPRPLDPTHPDQQALVFDPADANTVYLANDGGVFRGVYDPNWAAGSGPPARWRKVSTGLVVSQFYDLSASPVSRSVIGGGTQDNGTLISTGGLSWRHILGGDGGYVGFHPTAVHTFYAQYYEPDPAVRRARMMRTVDGGSTYSAPLDTGISGRGVFPASVFAIDPGNPLTIFTGTDRVFRSLSGGAPPAPAWSTVSYSTAPVAGDRVTEIAIASSSVVYAGTLKGRLYRSANANAPAPVFDDITPVASQITPAGDTFPSRWLSGITIHPADPNTVYVTFLGFNAAGAGSDQVWKGVFTPGPPPVWSWRRIASDLPDAPVGALVVDPATSNLYVATDVGVWRSTDDGAHWEPFEAGLPNVPVVDLALDPVRRLLRAATHGFGVFQTRIDMAAPEVDIYVRDNVIDTGEVIPCPSGLPDPFQPGAVVYHYQSADIKVDAPPFAAPFGLVDGVEFDDPSHRTMGAPFGYAIESYAGIRHDNPVRGQTNRVYVQVHNRGWKKADQVIVKLLHADAGAGLPPLPGDFWAAFPGDGFTQTLWKPIGTATISDLLPNVPRVLRWDWVPAATSSDHVCLMAMVHGPQDPLLPQGEINVDVLTPTNKRVTHRNVHPVTVTGLRAWVSLWFANAFTEARRFTILVHELDATHRGMRLILPEARVVLHEPLDRSAIGASATVLTAAQLRRAVNAARRAGQLSEYVAALVGDFHEAIVLDIARGDVRAELRDLILAPGERMPAVLTLALTPRQAREASWSFHVAQMDRERLIGGSEFRGAAVRRP